MPRDVCDASCLLQSESVVIPSAATVYAQVVTSLFFRRCNTFEPLRLPNGKCIVPPGDVARCSGAAAVHDLQLGQVTWDMFTPLTPPVPVFQYVTLFACYMPYERGFSVGMLNSVCLNIRSCDRTI